jgi:hypothetical protein
MHTDTQRVVATPVGLRECLTVLFVFLAHANHPIKRGLITIQASSVLATRDSVV